MLLELTLYGASVAPILQLTWRLRSVIVILARLVAARFMQRDGKAGIPLSNIRGGVLSIVTHSRCFYCNGETLFCMVVMSRACAERVPPCPLRQMTRAI
jgi:hypothetical protein